MYFKVCTVLVWAVSSLLLLQRKGWLSWQQPTWDPDPLPAWAILRGNPWISQVHLLFTRPYTKTSGSWLTRNTHSLCVSWTWRGFLALLLICKRAWRGWGVLQYNAWLGRDARLPGAARQTALVVPGCFQKTAGFAPKEKKRNRHREVRCLTELTQVHRHVRVMLISTSLRGMENTQPSTKFSLFADLLYLLKVSHSSGV